MYIWSHIYIYIYVYGGGGMSRGTVTFNTFKIIWALFFQRFRHHNSCYFIDFISFLKFYCSCWELLGTEKSSIFIGVIRYVSFRMVSISGDRSTTFLQNQ